MSHVKWIFCRINTFHLVVHARISRDSVLIFSVKNFLLRYCGLIATLFVCISLNYPESKMNRMRDDQEFNVQFVKTVEKERTLYDKSLPEYRSKEEHEKVWMRVSEQINESGEFYCIFYVSTLYLSTKRGTRRCSTHVPNTERNSARGAPGQRACDVFTANAGAHCTHFGYCYCCIALIFQMACCTISGNISCSITHM